MERKGNQIKATHTDSKGFLGRLYSLDHIKELSESGSIYGTITGKALYEKAFTLEEAIEAAS